MKCLSGFLALCILTSVFSWIHRCPPAENLAPLCTCKMLKSRYVDIVCNYVVHVRALSKQLSVLKNYVVDELEISNSAPLDMVDGSFRNLNILRLTFSDSNFGIFSLFSSLNGIQHTLEELVFSNCNVTRWVRSIGTHFFSLKKITFHNVNLTPILMPEDFANYPNSIENIRIIHCKITRLEKSSLKKFASLKYLHLPNNQLNSVSRNSLSPNLPKLVYIDLSDNPLETLSNDMFKHMPRLETLLLENTKLKTLHQEIFLPVWNQLNRVQFNNVWINCDCNSTWLINADWERKGYGPSCLGLNKPIQETTHQELCPERKST